jgi:hypothetical protein
VRHPRPAARALLAERGGACMTPSVLLASTATRWLGTARMPRVLARAGFHVALLAPGDSLATKSRHVSSVRVVSTKTTPMEWLLALIHMIEKVSPTVLVPCDEMAVRLLFALVLGPPQGFDPALHRRLVTLITDSLGDSRFYEASIDKTMLPFAAEALGVRVPRYAVATRVEDAIGDAAALGYPVVLKRRFGFAGQGVAVVSTRDELVRAAQRLLRADQLDLGEHRAPQLLVQAFVTGRHYSQALAALPGIPLASFAWERQVATNPVKGQTAVLRFVQSSETLAFAKVLCRGFCIGGFFNVQFVVDETTGYAHLLEINRRIVTHMHLGERVGKDLARSLYCALQGQSADPAAEEVPGESVVVFPREWLRDPQSRYLQELPVDVPWDEPELFAAMLAMRNE